MKYCIHCGTQLEDEAKFCSGCGKATTEQEIKNDMLHQQTPQQALNNTKTLGKIAYVFMIVTIVGMLLAGLILIVSLSSIVMVPEHSLMIWSALTTCLIPLLWTIPMTVYLKKKLNENLPIGVGYKVCTLLFVNLVSGILLLCRNEESLGE